MANELSCGISGAKSVGNFYANTKGKYASRYDGTATAQCKKAIRLGANAMWKKSFTQWPFQTINAVNGNIKPNIGPGRW